MFRISRQTILSLMILFGLLSGCILIKKNVENDIRAFLIAFESSLKKQDSEILTYFDASQPNEGIMMALKVLQNNGLRNLQCTAFFENAIIYFEDHGVRITIPVTIQSTDSNIELKDESVLTMNLRKKGESFYVSKFDGVQFYNSYLSMRNQIDGYSDIHKELLSRQSIFDQATDLQQQFDSVIWYAQYDSNTYFYVINGEWSNYFIRPWENTPKPLNYKMGLVDQEGRVIIPVEYDLIGTLGFSIPGQVEVRKDGRVGYFNLEGQQQIAADFDVIIPFAAEEVLITKRDSVYGWFNSAYQYYPAGFPSLKAEEYIKKFEFLPPLFQLGYKTQTMCEIPNENYLGYGIIVPPSYWTRTGIYSEIVGGFTTSEMPFDANTEYIETNRGLIATITDKINGLILTVKERYLEGREEFYTHDRLIFVNAENDTLATQDLFADGKVEFKKIGDNIIELGYFESGNYYEPEQFDEYPIKMYSYIQLNPDLSVSTLKSHRRFAFTQFIKMDSSYLTGDFETFVSGTKETVHTLSKNTLFCMRNEILADYGYRFIAQTDIDQFQYCKWYQPEFDSFSQIEDRLSEIDKYNFAFLEKILGPLKENPSI